MADDAESLATRGRVLNYAAPVYDLLMPIMVFGRHRRMARNVVDVLAPQPTERILDVGCGTGILADEVATRQGGRGEVIGIDASAAMVRAAVRKRGTEQCRFVACLAEDLRFPDASFDAVCSGMFFHHVDADLKRQALRECLRVLKPGGRLVVEDIGRPYTFLGALVAWTGRLLFMQPEIGENIRGILPALMTECGFRDVRVRDRHMGYVYVYTAVKESAA